MSTFGINWRKRATNEASQSDGETRSDAETQSNEKRAPRRTYSLRALLPGPYVRYPEEK